MTFSDLESFNAKKIDKDNKKNTFKLTFLSINQLNKLFLSVEVVKKNNFCLFSKLKLITIVFCTYFYGDCIKECLKKSRR